MNKTRKHILIVDDTTANLKSCAEVLRPYYRLSMAKTASQAFAFFDKCRPDLVILDIQMPDMNGYEMLEKMKRNHKLADIPVIFVTADTEYDSEIKGLRLGAMDYITKPYVPEVLHSRIENVLKTSEERFKLDMTTKKDLLTGLWNRKYMSDYVSDYVEGEDSCGAYLMIDMDNFKGVNDHFGHIMGDAVLVKFAQTLRETFGENAQIARIGGDEFSCFIKDIRDKREIADICEKLLDQIEEQVNSIENGQFGVSASIGVAVYPDDAVDFLDLYNKADKALYYVKQNGKSGYHFFRNKEEYSYLSGVQDTTVDMENLRRFFAEKVFLQGAYKVEYEGFRNIFQFVTRCIARTKQNVQLLLFTMSVKDPSKSEDEYWDEAYSKLEESIIRSLRRGDVETSFSSSQFVVILMDTSEENGRIVADRIMEHWKAWEYSGRFLLQYSLEEVYKQSV